MKWKYGLILVEVDEDNEELYELVELYMLDDSEDFGAFCTTRIMSVEELQAANADVERDGVNRYFYERGIFTRLPANRLRYEWDWKPHTEAK